MVHPLRPPSSGRTALGARPIPLINTSSSDRFDERSLVEAARHDANAFAALYRRYVERIHAYAYRRSGSRAIAEDVTSATFEKALRLSASLVWAQRSILAIVNRISTVLKWLWSRARLIAPILRWPRL